MGSPSQPQRVYLFLPEQLIVFGEGENIQFDVRFRFTTLAELEAGRTVATFDTVLCIELMYWKRALPDESVGFKGNPRGERGGSHDFCACWSVETLWRISGAT